MPRLNRSLARCLITAGFLASAVFAAAELVAVPGTKVALEPPRGFVAASYFAGFHHEGSGASVMIIEIPAPFEELVAGLTSENLLANGITLVTSEETAIGTLPGRLLLVTQTAGEVAFEKWLVVVGDVGASVQIIGTYPASLAAQLRAVMRAAVISARWSPDPHLDLTAGLGFTITESQDLKIQNRLQNMLMLYSPDSAGRGFGEP